MKVAIFSFTPLAASPWELFKALNKYTSIESHFITVRCGYPDGRFFPADLMLSRPDGVARKWLRESDLWHVHNYMHTELSQLRDGQKVMAQFHSLPRLGTWKELWDFADKRYTISQPLQEKEYGLPALPNLIDPDEYKPIRRDERIRIAFAPSSKAPIGMPNSKGYREVMEVLRSVVAKRDVDATVIEGKPYLLNLKMKAEVHILIDDVVTGNWHRTSLEGACFGCAVINKNKSVPWVQADIKTLENTLLELIDDRDKLAVYQEMARAWVCSKWHAMDGVREYVKAYEGMMQ
jgi:hypothetical protein